MIYIPGALAPSGQAGVTPAPMVVSMPVAIGAGVVGGVLTGAFYGAIVGLLACAFAPRSNPAPAGRVRSGCGCGG